MGQLMRRQTAAEQTAAHLREGIRAGRWTGKLPGVMALATECDVSPVTMRAAIRLLEQEGWIRNAGAGKARTVGVPESLSKQGTRPLRITILPGMRLVDEDADFQKLLMRLQHELEMAGHVCRVAMKSQQDLGHDVGRIERFVCSQPADAWVVIGPRYAVTEWFAAQPTPAICIGGSILDIKIAGAGITSHEVFGGVLRHLVGLGHRRILFLWPYDRFGSKVSCHTEQLARVLADVGIELSSYHLPEWTYTPEGLRTVLEKSFQVTPPTAIIITYGKWMAGVLSFLAARGLRAPKDISLFSLSQEDWFAWKEPQISCLHADDMQIVQRILRWVAALQRGKADRRFIGFPAQWIRGGTTGPPAKK